MTPPFIIKLIFEIYNEILTEYNLNMYNNYPEPTAIFAVRDRRFEGITDVRLGEMERALELILSDSFNVEINWIRREERFYGWIVFLKAK